MDNSKTDNKFTAQEIQQIINKQELSKKETLSWRIKTHKKARILHSRF